MKPTVHQRADHALESNLPESVRARTDSDNDARCDAAAGNRVNLVIGRKRERDMAPSSLMDATPEEGFIKANEVPRTPSPQLRGRSLARPICPGAPVRPSQVATHTSVPLKKKEHLFRPLELEHAPEAARHIPWYFQSSR